MSIPSLPEYINTKLVDKDGMPSPIMSIFFDQQHQTLSEVVNQHNEGMIIPSKTTGQITELAAKTSVSNGTIWFNSSINKLQLKVGTGSVETITSS